MIAPKSHAAGKSGKKLSQHHFAYMICFKGMPWGGGIGKQNKPLRHFILHTDISTHLHAYLYPF